MLLQFYNLDKTIYWSEVPQPFPDRMTGGWPIERPGENPAIYTRYVNSYGRVVYIEDPKVK